MSGSKFSSIIDIEENRAMPLHSRKKIPDMAEIDLLSPEEMDELKLIYPGMENRETLNAFRDLRTKLLNFSNGRNFVCLVSSLCDSGGASYVSMNLAASIALDKSKTSMIIDCNLDDPFVQNLVSVDPDFGLTDYLSNPDLSIEEIIYASGVPRMRLVPIGEHCEGGAEHFSSRRMEKFIDAVKDRYPDRFVIIDSPPIVSTAESRILASLADMVVLVVPYGRVSKVNIEVGINSVGPKKLAGLVFNN